MSFFWAFRRGSGGDASKRRKHTFTNQHRETLVSPAAPSGFPFQCFWLNTHHHSARREASSGTSVSPGNASLPKTFPLQSLTHARPLHIPVSRRTIRSPRPEHSPTPRTPHMNRPPRMGFAPDSGYRHATANAVDNPLQRYSRNADGGSFFSHAAGVRAIRDNEENFRDLPGRPDGLPTPATAPRAGSTHF